MMALQHFNSSISDSSISERDILEVLTYASLNLCWMLVQRSEPWLLVVDACTIHSVPFLSCHQCNTHPLSPSVGLVWRTSSSSIGSSSFSSSSSSPWCVSSSSSLSWLVLDSDSSNLKERKNYCLVQLAYSLIMLLCATLTFTAANTLCQFLSRDALQQDL